MKARLQMLTASFERLSGREQGIALLLSMVLLGLFLGLGSFFVSRNLNRREQAIAAKVEKLQTIAVMKEGYQRRLSEQNLLADQIRKNNDVRLLSYIEEISKQSNIQLRNAAERSGDPTGSEVIKEVAAEVNVESVSIDRLFDFLDRLEKGNRLVKVRKLEIETRFDNPKMLNAKVTVGTFKTADAG